MTAVEQVDVSQVLPPKDRVLAGLGNTEDPFKFLTEVPGFKFPQHLVVIPDGNGRLAEAKNFDSVTQGHKLGTDTMIDIVRGLSKLPIHTVDLWALTPENKQKRSFSEVLGIQLLVAYSLQKLLPEIISNNGRIVHLGDPKGLEPFLAEALKMAQEQTLGNTGQTIALAVNYGGELERINFINRAIQLTKEKGLSMATDEITEIARDPFGIGLPDFIIRTGKESDLVGLSGFPYSEYAHVYNTSTLFPDLTKHEVAYALVENSYKPKREGGRT